MISGEPALGPKWDANGYARRGDALVHVSQVERGLRCRCSCVKCGAALVAKKGGRRRHHFAHHVDSNCVGAAETALHMVAKEIFAELPDIHLPAYLFSLGFERMRGMRTPSVRLVPGGVAPIEHVEVEVQMGGIKPDVVVTSGGKQLIIEIAVTHRVDRAKKRALRRLNLPAIEISIDPNDALRPRDELAATLRTHVSNKSWLYHPRQRAVEGRFLRELREAKRRARASSRAEREKTAVTRQFRSPEKSPPPPGRGPLLERWSWSKLRSFEQWLTRHRRAHGVYPNVEETEAWATAHKHMR